jgi:hypothetical protein
VHTPNPRPGRTELFSLAKSQNETTRDASMYGMPADLVVDVAEATELLLRVDGPSVQVVDVSSGDTIAERRIEVTTGVVINDAADLDLALTIDPSSGDFSSIGG